jgi:4'-phosphopantetheinyl transferase
MLGPVSARPPRDVPAVRAGECQVWWATPSHASGRLVAVLSADERTRHAALRREPDRARLVTGAALLRIVAGRQIGLPPAEVLVDRTCPDCGRPHGKPRLPDTGLECSVSHAGDRVVVAVAGGAPIGVDVERVPDGDALHAALAAALAPAEAAALPGRAPDDRTAALVDAWTRKEAVLKATGEGLRVSMSDVVVSTNAGRMTTTVLDGRVVQVLALRPGAGYRAHLAVLGSSPVAVRERAATALLSEP